MDSFAEMHGFVLGSCGQTGATRSVFAEMHSLSWSTCVHAVDRQAQRGALLLRCMAGLGFTCVRVIDRQPQLGTFLGIYVFFETSRGYQV